MTASGTWPKHRGRNSSPAEGSEHQLDCGHLGPLGKVCIRTNYDDDDDAQQGCLSQARPCEIDESSPPRAQPRPTRNCISGATATAALLRWAAPEAVINKSSPQASACAPTGHPAEPTVGLWSLWPRSARPDLLSPLAMQVHTEFTRPKNRTLHAWPRIASHMIARMHATPDDANFNFAHVASFCPEVRG